MVTLFHNNKTNPYHPNISKLKLPLWSRPNPLGCFIISFNVTPKDYCYIYFLSSKDYGATKKVWAKRSTTIGPFFPRRSNILKLSLVISMSKTNRIINQGKRKKLNFHLAIHIRDAHTYIHILWSSLLHNLHSSKQNNATGYDGLA